ncbi:MAG TPA: hypothetical protein DEO70_08890 [Bacteroidales bacterium]|nr:MAG: hypothetical protein A2X09_10950 [Bacteroidetes bacterium GWF2_43_11]HBZ66943.1 hypothetical protein [Bacteroidales bacterium]
MHKGPVTQIQNDNQVDLRPRITRKPAPTSRGKRKFSETAVSNRTTGLRLSVWEYGTEKDYGSVAGKINPGVGN